METSVLRDRKPARQQCDTPNVAWRRSLYVKQAARARELLLAAGVPAPEAEDAAWDHLEREVETLRLVAGTQQVESICMHLPWGGRDDFFRETDRYVHPHASRYADVVYVSDSCRAWRDETLLECFADPPVQRLLRNTHPELWLGSADETREAFLDQTLLENTVRQHQSYVTGHVNAAWRAHPAPVAHDDRERTRRASGDARLP